MLSMSRNGSSTGIFLKLFLLAIKILIFECVMIYGQKIISKYRLNI